MHPKLHQGKDRADYYALLERGLAQSNAKCQAMHLAFVIMIVVCAVEKSQLIKDSSININSKCQTIMTIIFLMDLKDNIMIIVYQWKMNSCITKSSINVTANDINHFIRFI